MVRNQTGKLSDHDRLSGVIWGMSPVRGIVCGVGGVLIRKLPLPNLVFQIKRLMDDES